MQEKHKKLSDYFKAARAQEPPLGLEDIRQQLQGVPQAVAGSSAGTGKTAASLTLKKATVMVTGIICTAVTSVLLWQQAPQQGAVQRLQILPDKALQEEPAPQASAAASVATHQIMPAAMETPSKASTNYGIKPTEAVKAKVAPGRMVIRGNAATGPETLALSAGEGSMIVSKGNMQLEAQRIEFAPAAEEKAVTGEATAQQEVTANAPTAAISAAPETEKVFGKITTVELSQKDLAKLGVQKTAKGVFYENTVAVERKDNRVGLIKVELLAGIKSIHIGLVEVREPLVPFLPVYITAKDGKEKIKFTFNAVGAPRIKIGDTTDNFGDIVNSLVPVLVKVNKRAQDDVLLWFEPTAAFLDALPQAIAQEVKQEYEQLQHPEEAKEQGAAGIAEMKEQSVTDRTAEEPEAAGAAQTSRLNSTYKYFEAGNSNLTSIRYAAIYPNPAKGSISLSMSLKKSDELKVSLIDINGRLVKVLAPLKTYQAGTLTEKYDLQGVAPGMYIMLVEAQVGGRHSQRIMIQ